MPSLSSRSQQSHGISFAEALRVWMRVAVLSFGGPAGQIAVMHRILVDEKHWVSEKRFLHSLNYCMLLPGPEAQQLAIYIGWLLHGWRGGLAAGLLFVLPGFLAILALSTLYAGFQGLAPVEALFFGLKPAVMAVVIQAVVRIGRRALKTRTMVTVAALAFVSIFFLEIPFPLIVVAAAAAGVIGGFIQPEAFRTGGGHGSGRQETDGEKRQPALADGSGDPSRPPLRRSLAVAGLWLGIWSVPVIILAATLGVGHLFVVQGVFFSKAAVVTFGGAYAVLAYIAQKAVETYAWLEPGEMLDGLGMAETTPGPLIQVVQFVGFMAAYRNPGALDPMVAGLLASLIVTWVTFAPCFLWIFLGAPYIEYLRNNQRLNHALSAITAAVVGVVLNLAIWFGLHALFGEVEESHRLGFRLFIPDWSTLDLAAAVLTVGALIATIRFKVGILPTLAGSVVVGASWFLLTRG